MKAHKLLVFESHPIQYRVPIWQTIDRNHPGSIHVVFASDCSVQGHKDQGFGQTVRWDEPMLEGYPYTVLNCEHGEPLSGWGSLTGEGIGALIDSIQPTAILLNGLNYRFDWVAYWEAWKRNIPLWLRSETQDIAFRRSKLKSIGRSFFYRTLYSGISKFFYIGVLNRRHYMTHGVHPKKLQASHYCTVNRYTTLTNQDKNKMRLEIRKKANIPEKCLVVGFSGKMIHKKNPDILLNMLSHLSSKLLTHTSLYFIGSGELEDELKAKATLINQQINVAIHFTGFVNQSEIAWHYLAVDILVLPSRQMGETWGLVANEAMQAGCAVIVSDEVGCAADFKDWERFGIFKAEHADQLGNLVERFSTFDHNFNWASERLKNYSIESAAESLSMVNIC